MHIMIKPKQTWCNNALWRFVETICSGKEVTLLFVSPYWITTSFVMGLNASKITYTNPRVHNPLWPFEQRVSLGIKGTQVTLTLHSSYFYVIGSSRCRFHWLNNQEFLEILVAWQNVLNTKHPLASARRCLSCLPFWWWFLMVVSAITYHHPHLSFNVTFICISLQSLILCYWAAAN